MPTLPITNRRSIVRRPGADGYSSPWKAMQPVTILNMPQRKDGFQVLAFSSAADWEAWLEEEHAQCSGIWLKLAKKESGIASVSKAEAIEGALCFGWIDGQMDRFDFDFWLIRFTPRRAGSKWSEKNRTTAISLLGVGRVRAAGLREIDSAKADGRWESAYPAQSKAPVPPDLQEALDSCLEANEFFKQIDSANRYAILYRLHHTKRPEARAAKIKQFVEMLARGETIHLMKGASGAR